MTKNLLRCPCLLSKKVNHNIKTTRCGNKSRINEVCNVHKNAKHIVLYNGTIYENNKYKKINKMNKLYESRLFLRIDASQLNINKLRTDAQKYARSITSIQSYSYLILYLYFQQNVKTLIRLQRFVRNRNFRNHINGRISKKSLLKQFQCNNEIDPISQESFVNIPTRRWIISRDKHKNKWLFDIYSLIELIGSNHSYSLLNPFTRQPFEDEFLMKLRERSSSLCIHHIDEGKRTYFTYYCHQSYICLKLKKKHLFLDKMMFQRMSNFRWNLYIEQIFHLIELYKPHKAILKIIQKHFNVEFRFSVLEIPTFFIRNVFLQIVDELLQLKIEELPKICFLRQLIYSL